MATPVNVRWLVGGMAERAVAVASDHTAKVVSNAVNDAVYNAVSWRVTTAIWNEVLS